MTKKEQKARSPRTTSPSQRWAQSLSVVLEARFGICAGRFILVSQHCQGQKERHHQERQTRNRPLPKEAVPPLQHRAAGGGNARYSSACHHDIPFRDARKAVTPAPQPDGQHPAEQHRQSTFQSAAGASASEGEPNPQEDTLSRGPRRSDCHREPRHDESGLRRIGGFLDPQSMRAGAKSAT